MNELKEKKSKEDNDKKVVVEKLACYKFQSKLTKLSKNDDSMI